MHFLPKANPLYEQISANKVVIPDILEKLGKGHFTGYLSHSATDFEAYCIFAKGKLICAFSSEAGRDKTGFEAITQLFDKIFSVGGEINVYRMTADLAMCAHALILGIKLFNGEEVRHVDIKSMLARIKGQDMNGVVHFYTADRYAMMFYKNGLPIGFYHDGSRNIETSPDESRKVAALPGARLEVRSTKPVEELMNYDLLQMVNLDKLWEAASSRQTTIQTKEASLQTQEPTVQPKEPLVEITSPPSQTTEAHGHSTEKLTELFEDLQEVAMAYLSREGRILIEKRIGEAGGPAALLDNTKTEALLLQIEEDAKVIDSHARIDEMIDLMRSEIAGRLAV
ncbi:MAG: GTPase-activating protein [Geobacteraceae bacterium]|nr:GTPase-activating protein [Geobacteraceae bacterium]